MEGSCGEQLARRMSGFLRNVDLQKKFYGSLRAAKQEESFLRLVLAPDSVEQCSCSYLNKAWLVLEPKRTVPGK